MKPDSKLLKFTTDTGRKRFIHFIPAEELIDVFIDSDELNGKYIVHLGISDTDTIFSVATFDKFVKAERYVFDLLSDIRDSERIIIDCDCLAVKV